MDRIVEFINTLAPQFPLMGYERNTIYLRFGHIEYNKGSVLQELGRQLGIGPDCIFAAGDNHNDLSMLNTDIAHRIACPSNSIDEVKHHVYNAGGYVATRPGSAGMVETLAHYFVRSR